MKIYIAGKITGNPNYKEQFAAAEERLSRLGYAVVNPVMEEGYPYRYYINVGLIKLGHCDAIYLLRNWHRSKGARLERQYAKTVGIKIIKERRKWRLWELIKQAYLSICIHHIVSQNRSEHVNETIDYWNRRINQ